MVASQHLNPVSYPPLDLQTCSLSATFPRNRIIGSLGSPPDPNIQASSICIDPNVVFSSPSIRQVASVVDVKSQIKNMIDKYSVGFGQSTKAASAIVDRHIESDHVVVLTGSTGNLGSYLLASLLQREDVSVVYAFNRPSRDSTLSIQGRQKSSFEDRGFDATLLQSEKLVYVETDTSQDNLGLDNELYQKVCSISVLLRIVC